jgi:hypothetical protein
VDQAAHTHDLARSPAGSTFRAKWAGLAVASAMVLLFGGAGGVAADERAAPYVVTLEGGVLCADPDQWYPKTWTTDVCAKTGRIALSRTGPSYAFGLFNYWGLGARVSDQSTALNPLNLFTNELKTRRTVLDLEGGHVVQFAGGGKLGLLAGLRAMRAESVDVYQGYGSTTSSSNRFNGAGVRGGFFARVPLMWGLGLALDGSVSGLLGANDYAYNYSSAWWSQNYTVLEGHFLGNAEGSAALSYATSSGWEIAAGMRAEVWSTPSSTTSTLKELSKSGPFIKVNIPFGGN